MYYFIIEYDVLFCMFNYLIIHSTLYSFKIANCILTKTPSGDKLHLQNCFILLKKINITDWLKSSLNTHLPHYWIYRTSSSLSICTHRRYLLHHDFCKLMPHRQKPRNPDLCLQLERNCWAALLLERHWGEEARGQFSAWYCHGHDHLYQQCLSFTYAWNSSSSYWVDWLKQLWKISTTLVEKFYYFLTSPETTFDFSLPSSRVGGWEVSL